MSLILGWFHGFLFFILRGQRARQLPIYILVTAIVAVLAQLIAFALTVPAFLAIGDCNVPIIVASCWIVFLFSRVAIRQPVGQTQR